MKLGRKDLWLFALIPLSGLEGIRVSLAAIHLLPPCGRDEFFKDLSLFAYIYSARGAGMHPREALQLFINFLHAVATSFSKMYRPLRRSRSVGWNASA